MASGTQTNKSKYNFELYMVRTEAQVKRWGNSLGIIIPKEVAIKEGLKPEDRVTLHIEKKRSLKEFYGKGRGLAKNVQQIKDEAKNEWLME